MTAGGRRQTTNGGRTRLQNRLSRTLAKDGISKTVIPHLPFLDPPLREPMLGDKKSPADVADGGAKSGYWRRPPLQL